MALLRHLPEIARTMRVFEDPFFTRGVPSLFGGQFLNAPGDTARPANVDITENDQEYRVLAELPGVDKSNLQVNVVDESTLQIKGAVRHGFVEGPVPSGTEYAKPSQATETAVQRAEDDTHVMVSQERYAAAFTRSVTFPQRVQLDGLRAKLKDGLLEVTVPKAHPKTTRVPIEVE